MGGISFVRSRTILVGALASVAAACILAGWYMTRGVFSSSRFDERVWLARLTEKSDSTCYRGGMAKDVALRVIRVGMSHEEVLARLGRPDSSNPKELLYLLGACSG